MSLHSFFEYLRYRRKAMGRHGMHSPFVYALIEDGIQKNRQVTLIKRIQAFLKEWPQVTLPADRYKEWDHLTDALCQGNMDRRMIIVESIHSSKSHTAAWKNLRLKEGISYSLDLYDFGLLFISPDFKVKQHFVLKQ